MNLTKFRKLKGLSQRELESLSGISHRMINYYENNPSAVPMQKLKTLADALEISIADFFSEENNNIEIEDLDVRWIKKVNEIKNLPEADRKEINRHINSLLEKRKLQMEKESSK